MYDPVLTDTDTIVLTDTVLTAAPLATMDLDGKTYYIYRVALPWAAGKKFCQSLALQLATISSEEQNSKLCSAARAKLGTTAVRLWTGATDAASEGVWKWEDQAPWVYSKWASGEGTGGINENCAFLDMTLAAGRESYWGDAACSGAMDGFICTQPGENPCIMP
jgi:hypothetical protein